VKKRARHVQDDSKEAGYGKEATTRCQHIKLPEFQKHTAVPSSRRAGICLPSEFGTVVSRQQVCEAEMNFEHSKVRDVVYHRIPRHCRSVIIIPMAKKIMHTMRTELAHCEG
jgi:hypothetical protein